jgi:Rrf2 family iron-sulfur cluster assembly transcriptional regulator
MLTPSRKTFYAVEAVLFIAYNCKAGPISSAEIAAQQDLPTRYLEPLMQKLVRAGILRGVRGPSGGYVLGRERRRITLKDICDVVEEEHTLPESTMPLGSQVLNPEVKRLLSTWSESLTQINIASLCDRAGSLGIETLAITATDFAI